MKTINVSVLLLIAIFSINTHADNKEFLTVDKLVDSGYRQMTGEQIMAVMSSGTIKVVDIETDAVIISKHDKPDVAMERKFEEKKTDNAASLFNPKLMARAPKLDGKIEREVIGDELVSTNGIRTYHFRLYKKQEKIYAVRDVDHGNVFFEIK